MLRVGLTGGIGSGKSTVAGRLAEHGAVVIDADVLAREAVAVGSSGLDEVVAAFGRDILAADGSLNRPALAAVVFADSAARTTLNGIVHPRVGARTAELIAGAPSDAVVVYDVPLLVENGMAPGFHLAAVVDAPVPERIRRLVSTRGMTESEAMARIEAQASEPQRRAAADLWLDNSARPDQLMATVDALWVDRLVPFEANVRLHRRAAGGPPRLVDADPDWPAQAERLAARIRVAVGPAAARVDHIGSTAIPGLSAKDVIDLQLTVSSLDVADELAAALAEAGFPRAAHVTGDSPKPFAPDPAQWGKRLHCNADPGRLVNLHLRVAGSPGWRFALLFRDWLRDDDQARARYQEFKRELANRFASDANTRQYAAAKEPWFDAALPSAEAWAAQSGWTAPEQ